MNDDAYMDTVRTSQDRFLFRIEKPRDGVLVLIHIPTGERVQITDLAQEGCELSLQRVEYAIHSLNLGVGIATYPGSNAL